MCNEYVYVCVHVLGVLRDQVCVCERGVRDLGVFSMIKCVSDI